MMQLCLYTPDTMESTLIRHQSGVLAAKYDWADCEVYTADNLHTWAEQLKTAIPSILICDVSTAAAIEVLQKVRKAYPQTLVIPIAGADIPPTSYVQPDIMPCALLWRPLTERSVTATLQEMLFRLHQGDEQPEGFLEVNTRQRSFRIPYHTIFFIEARSKKLYVRQADQEFCFYGTLAELEQKLPETFIRCHKSFLVNRGHIISVQWAEQRIQLDHQIQLPLSRSCRRHFREEFDGAE